MEYRKITMKHDKTIGLVAHDHKKGDLVAWAKYNAVLLAHQTLCDGHHRGDPPAGARISRPQAPERPARRGSADRREDRRQRDRFPHLLLGPAGAAAARPRREGAASHGGIWHIPIACNRASADFMISSPLMDSDYDRLVPDYDGYRSRALPTGESAAHDRDGEDPGPVAVSGDEAQGTA